MMTGKNVKRQLNDNGFTLVEMIVVLIIMAILLSLTVVGVMTWQDWSKMKQLNADAEEIFMAAQAQLSDYSASGALQREVLDVIEGKDGVVEITQYQEDGSIVISSITDPSGMPYDWNKVWKTEGKPADEASKYQGRIISVSSIPGDYEVYLKDDSSLNAGTALLFKLISSHISDKSILNNGSTIVEFSPDAAQVLSVCYTDKAGKLAYYEEEGAVCVNNRREDIRNGLSLGYYGINTLSKAIKGKTDNSLDIKPGAFELWNEELLEALYVPEDEDQDFIFGNESDLTFILSLYDPEAPYSSDDKKKVMELEFDLNKDSTLPYGMKDAQGSGAKEVRATYYQSGTKKSDGILFRLPIWIDYTSNGNRVICIALDAADIQAQSVTAATAMGLDTGESYSDAMKEESAEAFSKTYSFYRFGLDADRIFLSLQIRDNSDNSRTKDPLISSKKGGDGPDREGEYATFDTVTRSGFETEYKISNGRHLYNVRFVEDYADKISETEPEVGELKKNKDWHFLSKHNFKLIKDINWREFVSYQYRGSNAGTDYLFDSYDPRVSAVGGKIVYSGIGLGGLETETVEFPAFKQICFGDSFSALKGDNENYKISDITITTDANERYGVYGLLAKDNNRKANQNINSQEFDDQEFERAAGLHPTGLFAYNFGEIGNLTLARHKVFGAYKVGGFAGESMGSLHDLVLQNDENTAGAIDKAEEACIGKLSNLRLIIPTFNGTNKKDGISYFKLKDPGNDVPVIKSFISDQLYKKNTSFVVGIHDVGGICGYQKYIAAYGVSGDVEFNGLINEGWVAGQVYVGGIIGRALSRATSQTDRYMDIDPFAGGAAGAERKNIAKLVFADNKNTGRIQALPVYDTGDFEDIDNSDDALVNTRNSFYIGGICGMASDNNTSDGYAISYASDDPKLVLRNCISYWQYSADEIDNVITNTAGDMSGLKSMMRTSYYGGLVGYARQVLFENCSTLVPEEESTDGKYEFIFGRYFVGGFAGVAQACEIICDDGERSTNAFNVIGSSGVGGIAGLIGMPAKKEQEDMQSFLYYYQYTACDPGIDYPYNGETDMCTQNIRDLLNIGLSYATGSDEYPAWSGGICGINCEQIDNCDSILDKYAKEEMLKLMIMADGKDGSAGDCVGGLAGFNSWRINFEGDSRSEINTVVYGRNNVGGAVGTVSIDTEDSDTVANSVRNCYLVDSQDGITLAAEQKNDFKGSYIRAVNDKAGGICGLLESGAVINDESTGIVGDFVVHAKNFAGGFIGHAKGKSGKPGCQYAGIISSGSVKADGFFAGGFAGAISQQATGTITYSISAVKEVEAGSFAGGFAGAAILPTLTAAEAKPATPPYFYKVDNDKMTVKAAKAVAGGYYGYYQVAGQYMQDGIERLYALLKDHQGSSLELISGLESINGSDLGVYAGQYQDSLVGDSRGVNNGNSYSNLKIENVTVKAGMVEAGLAAGGLFGYIHSDQSIYIEHTGEANVKASASELIDGKFAYAGGITGRAGSRMVLHGCLNKGVIWSDSEYYGNLCEINRGVIEDCYVGYACSYPNDLGAGHEGLGSESAHIYVGGLCGRNEGELKGSFGGLKNAGEYTGICDVSGIRYVGGLCGENVAQIRIKDTGYHYVISVHSEEYAGGICGVNRFGDGNTAGITSAEEGITSDRKNNSGAEIDLSAVYAGLVAGRNEGSINGLTIGNEGINLYGGTDSGRKGAAGTFVGVNAAIIAGCNNNADINTGAEGAAGGFAGMAEGGAKFSNLINKGEIKAVVTAAGIVALINNDDSDKSVTIEKCRNYGTVSAESGNGFAFTSSVAVTLSNCLEAGGISDGGKVVVNGAAATNNYYISGRIDAAGHTDEYVFSDTGTASEEYYELKAGVNYVFSFSYEKDGDKTVLIDNKIMAFSEDKKIRLSAEGIYDLFWPDRNKTGEEGGETGEQEGDPEVEDPEEENPEEGDESEFPQIIEGAMYHLSITTPAEKLGTSDRGLTLLSVSDYYDSENSKKYSLYAVIKGRAYDMGIKGLTYDPLKTNIAPRIDELENVFWNKLVK